MFCLKEAQGAWGAWRAWRVRLCASRDLGPDGGVYGEATLRFVGPGTLDVTSGRWLHCLEPSCLLHEVQMAAVPGVDGPGAGMSSSEGLRRSPQRGNRGNSCGPEEGPLGLGLQIHSDSLLPGWGWHCMYGCWGPVVSHSHLQAHGLPPSGSDLVVCRPPEL